MQAEPYSLVWISPILSQVETETLSAFINELAPVQENQIEFLNVPKDSLKIVFSFLAAWNLHDALKIRENIFSEILAKTYPVETPYLVSFLSDRNLFVPKKLVCFDMDSTLINEEVIDEIAREAGFYDQVAEITESAMRGEIEFQTALRARVKLFDGTLKAAAMNIIPKLTLSPGAESFISSLRTKEIKTAVLSGGFEFVLKHFQKQLFIDQVYGNILDTDVNDEAIEVFNGQVLDPIIDAEFKRTLVIRLQTNYAVTKEETITVGDGANDIPMMNEAGISVSFCGKPKLAAYVNTLVLDRDLTWLKTFI